jgi:hypothetical protein
MEDENAKPVFETSSWVRITRGDEILFSSSDLQTNDGTVDFEYNFPTLGEYEMTVRMIGKEEHQEANVTFPVQVGDDEQAALDKLTKQERRTSNFNLAVLTLVIGFISGVLIARFSVQKGNSEN